MEKPNCVSLLVFLLLLGHQTHGQVFSPAIFPDAEYLIIPANGTLSLKCLGKTFVSWSPPRNSGHSNISIESRKAPHDDYAYESILTIKNISYLDYGDYYCLENTCDINDFGGSASTYVFVNDSEHLSVMSELPPFRITTVESSEVILPCRPTSPDVQVELLNTFDGEEIPIDIIDDFGNFVTYDPREGYSISEIAIGYASIYDCIYTRGPLIEHSIIVLNINPYELGDPPSPTEVPQSTTPDDNSTTTAMSTASEDSTSDDNNTTTPAVKPRELDDASNSTETPKSKASEDIDSTDNATTPMIPKEVDDLLSPTNNTTPGPNSTPKPVPERLSQKRKAKNQNKTDLEVLRNQLLPNQPEDKLDYEAKTWAATLRDLTKEQQIYAEKVINEVMFEAQMGNLNRDSGLNSRRNLRNRQSSH